MTSDDHKRVAWYSRTSLQLTLQVYTKRVPLFSSQHKQINCTSLWVDAESITNEPAKHRLLGAII